jgi:archaellum component FlaC
MSDDTSLYIHTLVGMRFDVAKIPMTPEYQAQIEEYEKALSQLSLPEIRAEYQRAELVRLRFGKPEYALSESELAEKGNFEERLSKMLPSELVRHESASEEETVKNLVGGHRLRALTPELRASYLGEPPDYVHWAELEYWTRGEAISLTIGLDPKVDLLSERHDVFAPSKSSSKVEQAIHALKMTREEAWKQISDFGYPTDPTMGFDEDGEEVLRKWTFTDAAAEYIQLQDRIERAIEVGKLGDKIIPAPYVIWATNSNISVPSELIRAVNARSEIPDWKAKYEAASHECDALKRELETASNEYDSLKRELETASNECDALKRELETASNECDALKRELETASNECDALKRGLEELRSTHEKKQDLSTRERSTVKRLIIGMAIRGYKYNPNADRNLATKEIADDLELLGISLDVDTVRKWLNESREELPSDWQPG